MAVMTQNTSGLQHATKDALPVRSICNSPSGRVTQLCVFHWNTSMYADIDVSKQGVSHV